MDWLTVAGKGALTAMLLVIAVVDLRTRRVPHWLSWPGLAAAVAYRAWQGCWTLIPLGIGMVLLDLVPLRRRVAGLTVLFVVCTWAGWALGQGEIVVIAMWWAAAYVLWLLRVMGAGDARLFWSMMALFPDPETAMMLLLGLVLWAGAWLLTIERERSLRVLLETGGKMQRGEYPTKAELQSKGRATTPGIVLGALAYVWLLA